MERFLILNDVNTYYDLHLILTALSVSPPEAKTNYVELDGMSGTLDLTESLSGEVTYKDRTITATLWTDYGNYNDRNKLLNELICKFHGKKIMIIEPDHPEQYFNGRVKITPKENNLAYLEFTLEATCEPWRYALEDSTRTITVNSVTPVSVVINNDGVKTVCPVISVSGDIDLVYNDTKTSLTEGSYTVSNIKFKQGVNVIEVSGNGSATFSYKEATL